jgi:uncharacterized damage-inducible protein DinB
MTTKAIHTTRPAAGEFLPYYGTYIDQVPDGDIVESMNRQLSDTLSLIRSLDESDGDKRYAPEKWSIREIIGHVIDAERIFVYRALRFSRADPTPVPGFDENMFAANAPYSKVSLSDLADELEHVRRSSAQFFSHLDEEVMSRRGNANGHEISVRALAWILTGHDIHHVKVIRTRYLNQ